MGVDVSEDSHKMPRVAVLFLCVVAFLTVKAADESASASPTLSDSPSASATASVSESSTASTSESSTSTASASATASVSESSTASVSESSTASNTPSISQSSSESATPTISESSSASASSSASDSATASPSLHSSESASASISDTSSASPTISVSASISESSSNSISASASSSKGSSQSASATKSHSHSHTQSQSHSHSTSVSASISVSTSPGSSDNGGSKKSTGGREAAVVLVSFVLVGASAALLIFRMRQSTSQYQNVVAEGLGYKSVFGVALWVAALVATSCSGSALGFSIHGYKPFHTTYNQFITASSVISLLSFSALIALDARGQSIRSQVLLGIEAVLALFAFCGACAATAHFNGKDSYCAYDSAKGSKCLTYQAGIFFTWLLFFAISLKMCLRSNQPAHSRSTL
eukprot:c3785_g1_i1.p1 GENE.c3785_g1_i1~~c3785_g1_i1.p1  ORF type:complete len:411 (-),score=79.61 c3785_g1_i1:89-1321(-)